MEDKKSVIAVTNRRLCGRPFLEQIERVCAWGPQALILREKDLTKEAYCALAKEVLAICGAYGVDCILHSFFGTALALGAEAIHLPLPLLKEVSEEEKKKFNRIGCSVHSVEEALLACRLGASYLTAGHIYATDCKRDLAPRGTAFLKEICENVQVPVYAIGGISYGTGQMDEVKHCGAAGVCIMSGMMRL